MNMPYVVYARYGTKPQNKLQQAIADLVMKQDRLLLTELEAEKFKDDIKQHIAGLNAKHKMAKPVKIHWWNPHLDNERGRPSDKDAMLGFDEGGYGFVNCTLLYCQKPE